MTPTRPTQAGQARPLTQADVVLGAKPSDLAALMLDFDGVLQTPALDDWREMEHCDELQRLLDDLPSLRIVVTSSHREGRTLADLQSMLPEPIAQRVIGSTPVTALGRARGGRQREVEQWLAQHPQVRRYAAVDDEPSLYDRGCPWLAVTNPRLGWSEDTTEQLRQLLGEPRQAQPSTTGSRTAPSDARTSHRCLPSTKLQLDAVPHRTGIGGHSVHSPAVVRANQSASLTSRRGFGKSGSSLRAAAVRTAMSIWTTVRGARTRS